MIQSQACLHTFSNQIEGMSLLCEKKSFSVSGMPANFVSIISLFDYTGSQIIKTIFDEKVQSSFSCPQL